MTLSTLHRPWRGLLLLWLIGLLINLWGIQQGPLRDWDESLVARVALELSNKPWPDLLLPSQWGAAYLNKPPGAHWLIAGLIRLWRSTGGTGLPPEWLLRLGPAAGSSLLAPLLGLVQWQLRPGRRLDCLWTAAIALSLLPLARHAHLAMLDGLQLAAMALLWLGMLMRQPRGPLPGLIAGLAGSALLLLKAPVVVPVLAVSLLLLGVEPSRSRPRWGWLLLGLALGLLPGLAWHGWHLAWRGDAALVMWGRQGFARVANAIENHSGGPIPPLIQVLTGGWPWLVLWPLGIQAAWRERSSRWGRWCLGLTAMASAMVLPLQTQLPWYSLLLWPPFALCCGPVMTALVSGSLPAQLRRGIGSIWLVLGLLLFGGAIVSKLSLAAPAAAGLIAAGLIFSGSSSPLSQRHQAAWGLLGAWCISLLLLFSSPLWNWELNERPSIRPLQALVSRSSRTGALASLPLVVEGSIGNRPSLRWYAEARLGKGGKRGSIDSWQRQGGLLLVSQAPAPEQSKLARTLGVSRINSQNCRLERRGTAGWQRWLCQ